MLRNLQPHDFVDMAASWAVAVGACVAVVTIANRKRRVAAVTHIYIILIVIPCAIPANLAAALHLVILFLDIAVTTTTQSTVFFFIVIDWADWIGRVCAKGCINGATKRVGIAGIAWGVVSTVGDVIVGIVDYVEEIAVRHFHHSFDQRFILLCVPHNFS